METGHKTLYVSGNLLRTEPLPIKYKKLQFKDEGNF
jgi:hypothetical protein